MDRNTSALLAKSFSGEYRRHLEQDSRLDVQERPCRRYIKEPRRPVVFYKEWEKFVTDKLRDTEEHVLSNLETIESTTE